MSTLSNNTKVVLYPDNFLDHNQMVSRHQCMVVQSYDYELERARNAFGEAYGVSSGNLVTIKVRVCSRNSMKVFYDRLADTFSTCLSLIYNVHYNDLGFIDEFSHDGALVMEGYIVDIDEELVQSKTNRNNDELMLTLKFLASKMVVVGSSHNIEFNFKD